MSFRKQTRAFHVFLFGKTCYYAVFATDDSIVQKLGSMRFSFFKQS